ncbi:MAG: thermonuclease family protein [Acidobacteriota bacterium]
MRNVLRFVLLAAFTVMLVMPPTPRSGAEGKERRAANIAIVLRVNDGDTITVRINGRHERVRLIGIDAPEMAQFPWGVKAKRHLQEILLSSREVFLELDIDKRDKYGRLLAYVRTGDGRMINEEMVNDGYAVLFTYPPNVRYVSLFNRAQADARRRKAGIWGGRGFDESPSRYRSEHPRR